MAVRKTWQDATFARSSVAYNSNGVKLAPKVPRYEYARNHGPRWQDLFGSDSLGQYISSGSAPTTWSVAGGKLLGSGGTNGLLTKKNVVLKDCEIVINCDQCADGGIIARYVDDNNFYAMYTRDDGAATAYNFVITKVQGGTWTTLWSTNSVTDWPRGTSRECRFVLKGNRLECWYYGRLLGVVYDNTFTSGAVGLFNNNATAIQVLDFTAYAVLPAIMMEEGTTNLLTANLASVETDTTGFTALGSTISRNLTQFWHGVASLKVITDNAALYEGFMPTWNTTPATPGNTYAGQVRLKGSGTVRVYTKFYTAAGGGLSESTLTTVTLTNAWQLASTVAHLAPATAAYVSIIVSTPTQQGITFYADGLQIEQKAYATSWQLPGTARTAETLTLPTAGVFNRGNWAVDLVWKSPPSLPTAANSWFWTLYIDANNYYGLYIQSTGEIGLVIRALGTSVYRFSAVLSPNTNYHITATGNGTSAFLYLNGVQQGAALSYTEPVGALPTNMYWGSYYLGTLQPNGHYSCIRVSNRARSLAEHLADYSSGRALDCDIYTTALMTGAGHLKAYKKRLTVQSDSNQAWVLQPLGADMLSDSDLPLMPGFKKYSEEIDNYHGELDFGGYLQNGKFSLACSIRKSNALKFAFLNYLKKYLNPFDGYMEYEYIDDNPGVCLLVRPTGDMPYANLIDELKFKLGFENYPFWESSQINWWWSGDLCCLGLQETPCLITFYDACVNPSITINGVTVTYTGTLVAGDKVEIDTGNKTAKLTQVGGGISNVRNVVSDYFPLLQPGSNYVTSAFFASVQWKDRW